MLSVVTLATLDGRVLSVSSRTYYLVSGNQMKLRQIRIEGFRSVKENINLIVDPKVTILIGANDHGKTNLLEAIRALNADRPFVTDDENWDSVGQGKPVVKYEFQLDPDEKEWIRSKIAELEAQAAKAVATEAADETVSKVNPATSNEATSSTAGRTSVETAEAPAEDLQQQGSRPQISSQIPETITFIRSGVGGDLELQFDAPSAEIEDDVDYLFGHRPRIELFASVEQLMNVVTLQELDEPKQEFMQGIFRYAGIWSKRKGLFKQDPATGKRLEKASEEFTRRIRDEWKQGENLTFRFQHAGQNGNQIELLIRDPAVSDRFVRPSERSEGFSAFFKLNMRLLARTESNPANKYIFLFDEPGTALHPSGQVNLQRVFERLSKDNQIVYATHSLFMVNHNRPERNRVVSKDTGGTKVDQKPYLRNWRAVRDSLGLILAGNFFIADTTLLLEGESDAMYVGAVLAALDRAEIIDIDLNLFSVQWAGNVRDFTPMARLMLEEGRHVVACMDGDRTGSDIRKKVERLNAAIGRGRVVGHGPVEIVQLDRNQSIEDVLPSPNKYFDAVVAAAEDLVSGNYLTPVNATDLIPQNLLQSLKADKGNVTLGRHVDIVTKKWFTENEPISKLTIAHHYCASLEGVSLKDEGASECPEVFRRLIDALKLESKLSEKTVLAETSS